MCPGDADAAQARDGMLDLIRDAAERIALLVQLKFYSEPDPTAQSIALATTRALNRMFQAQEEMTALLEKLEITAILEK